MTFARTFRRHERVTTTLSPSSRGYYLRENGDGETAVVDWDNGGPAVVRVEHLRHAPCRVVGARRAVLSTVACPSCGTALERTVLEKGEERIPTRVDACGGCEFIEEVR